MSKKRMPKGNRQYGKWCYYKGTAKPIKSKKVAQERAIEKRKKGFLARVVKDKKGYNIFLANKNWRNK